MPTKIFVKEKCVLLIFEMGLMQKNVKFFEFRWRFGRHTHSAARMKWNGMEWMDLVGCRQFVSNLLEMCVLDRFPYLFRINEYRDGFLRESEFTFHQTVYL